jgi:hypothetical protein
MISGSKHSYVASLCPIHSYKEFKPCVDQLQLLVSDALTTSMLVWKCLSSTSPVGVVSVYDRNTVLSSLKDQKTTITSTGIRCTPETGHFATSHDYTVLVTATVVLHQARHLSQHSLHGRHLKVERRESMTDQISRYYYVLIQFIIRLLL